MKNFPATLAGNRRPLRISVRSIATVIGNSFPNTATAFSSLSGASPGHWPGAGSGGVGTGDLVIAQPGPEKTQG